MERKHFLFDLDETLYPPDTGLWPILGSRMNTFIHTRLGIPMDEVEELRERYFHTYGTSLRGLQADYAVDANEYLDFVHDVQISDFIQPDPQLTDILASLSGDKIIFTNANKAHSKRVLQALGVEHFFSQIVDVVDMDPYCKPYPQAFEVVMKLVNDPDSANYILLDDSIKNVQAALDIGMSAIHVSPRQSSFGHIKHITCIHDIRNVIPSFFEV
jgi:putative hydrolase of the HAD superfamily